MIAEFRLPDLGEGLPEAEIVQWLVAPGDVVALNQPIAEVETAKAIVELPSPFAGTVSALRAEAGDVVAVGEALIAVDVEHAGTAHGASAGAPSTEETTAGGWVAEAAAGGESENAEDAVPESAAAVPNLVGYGAAPRAGGRPRRRARSAAGARGDTALMEAALLEEAAADVAPHDALPLASAESVGLERPRSTPPVRKLAKDLGIDLALVAAAGASEIVTRADVEQFAARTGLVPRVDADHAPGGAASLHASVAGVSSRAARDADVRETRIPLRGVRRATADAMVRSAFTAPHVTTFLTLDVTATTAFIERLRLDPALAEQRIGILAVAAKAVCLALRRLPELNARWAEATGEIVQHGYVNLGIAVATPRGLVVPNVKDADGLTLPELARALGELAQAARAGRVGLADLSGGTFSITNFGVFGVDAGTPILNPGEAGILGLGAVQRRPWEHEGSIALRDVLTLSLSFDHRLVDGAEGSRFLTEVAAVLRDPGRAMVLA